MLTPAPNGDPHPPLPEICNILPFFLSAYTRSGKKNEHKPKLFGPDIFGWGGGLPREGVGAKKFGTSFKTQNQTFWRDIPGFLPGYPGGARKL